VTIPFPIRPARRDDEDLDADGTGGGAQHEPFTDLGNARRLVAAHGHRIRYVPMWRRWLIWDGTRWADDDTGQVWRCAKHVARGMLHSAASAPTADDRDKLIAAAKRAESARGLRAMLELAGTEKTIALAPRDLDADPYLLNVANGTLDLRTGQLHPHNPASHITKVCAAAHRPEAQAPRFAAFLERIQPDPQMRAFLGRLLGYGLLGLVTEHVLPIFYGGGGNGKGTLLETVMAVMGSYGSAVDPELLVTTNSTHPTGVADLFGMRLALAQETDSGRRLAEGTVKRLTGGDTIRARRMHENFWSFDPSHLVIMQTNHKPIITGTDEGIWRRVTLVPFDVQIPESERDGNLRSRLLLEADGILSWLLSGYHDYAEHGLAAPCTVTAATADYRASSDDLGRFIDECCVVADYFHVTKAALFAAWQRWCETENLRPGTAKKFGSMLIDRGFDPDERDHRAARIWRGIALRSEDDEPPSPRF
jgi:putative DNA primase/helicase